MQMSYAQNRVPNHSFEEEQICPGSIGLLTGYCSMWYNFTSGSPDFYDTCRVFSPPSVPSNIFGYQQAIGGAYVGIYTYTQVAPNKYVAGGEYIATAITPLVVNKFYEVSLSVNLANNFNGGNSGMGVFFYDSGVDSIKTTPYFRRIPQVSYDRFGAIIDTLNWVRLKGYLLADSAYDHIVIGQFTDTPFVKKHQYKDLNSGFSAYYYIDSVVVTETSNLNIEFNDSLLCTGDTIQVGCFVNPIYFNSGNSFTVQLSDSGGSFVSPISIGAISSRYDDTIQAVIPSTIPSGKHYRIRIASNAPSLMSPDNGFDISIGTTKPTIAISSNSPVCLNDTLLISGTTSTSNVVWRYWRPYTNPVIINSGVISKKAGYVDTGLYIINASARGCASRNDTISIKVLRPFGHSVEVNVSPKYTVPSGTELTFTAKKSTLDIDTATYQWLKNGLAISGATDTFLKAILGTDFYIGDTVCVERTTTKKCAIVKTVSDCISYSEYLTIPGSHSIGYSVYPNPCLDKVVIKNTPIGSEILLVDPVGIVLHKRISTWGDNEVLSTESLSPGCYMIVVRTLTGDTQINRLIKL